MKGPKVVVIGAGSLFFGRQAIWQMVHSPGLNTGTLGLVDIDPQRVAKMAKMASMVIADTGVGLKLEASTDAREVLKGADFVVLSFADRSAYFRDIDCQVAAKYGVRMCSGDTIGPGGIFRTLREFPKILQYARDIEALCPDAWVINYINPTAANGIGLRKYAPKLKSFALCDGLHMPHVKRAYAVRAGIIPSEDQYSPEVDRKFDLRIAGPNHFTWILKAEYEGRDVMGPIAETLRQAAATETDGGDVGAKAKYNDAIGYALYEVFGKVPACVGHTKEYVRFWQGLGRTPEPLPPLSLWEVEPRYRWHESMWQQVEDFIDGTLPIGEYMTTFKPDHATDIIESMWMGLKKPFYVNTPNRGAVDNLPQDAFLELLCDLTMDGPVPRPAGSAPVGLRGLWQQVLDSHELSTDAAITGDRTLLRQALLCDPMMSSIADADRIISELLAAERDALPAYWFSPRDVK